MLRTTVLTISLLLTMVSPIYAETEMADIMRSNGKIYVVVVVLATIFAGLFVYLFSLDRKVGKLEKESNH